MAKTYAKSKIMKNVSIVIVVYNSQKQIAKCIESIKNSARKNLRFNLVIIDNASPDNSIEIVKNFDFSKIIENKNNVGFASAVNQGLRYAKQKFNSDYFLLLNPDAFLEKNCLEKTIEKAEKNENIGLVSPLIINPKTNRPWFCGAKINWFKMQTRHSDFPTHYLSGCCLLISKPLIEKIGFLDERFFLYYEDADYSLRARKAGFQIALEKEAVCYHDESQSSTSEIKNYHLVKSGLLFFHKYYPRSALAYFWTIFLLRFIYHHFFSHKKEVLSALKDFYKNKKSYKL